jgi:hypothetical protein
MEPMNRGRSQVLWRYTPQSSYRYSDNGPWCVTNEITINNKENLHGALALALRTALEKWKAIRPDGFPDPVLSPSKYVVGEPFNVFYSMWPLLFECASCHTAQYFQDIAALKRFNPALRCRECKKTESLRQIPYSFICHCGRIDTPYMPRCRKDKTHSIQLIDKKSFQDSYWRCKACGTRVIQGARAGLGVRSCKCGRVMRGSRLNDPRNYFAQTLSFVAVEPKTLSAWENRADQLALLLFAAGLGLEVYNASHIVELSAPSVSEVDLDRQLMATREVLKSMGLSEAQVSEKLAEISARAGFDPWAAYEEAIRPYEDLFLAGDFVNRQTIEYIFVRDDKSCAPLNFSTLIVAAREAGDEPLAANREQDLALAHDLGIDDLKLIQQLPLVLAAYGYTRHLSDPYSSTHPDAKGVTFSATLRPFDSLEEKIPIYVARNSTEGVLVSLDPIRAAAYLHVNLGLGTFRAGDRSAAGWRAWLLEHCRALNAVGEAHLELFDSEREAGVVVEPSSALLFGALHSLMHVLKATAHKFVGIDGDSLAEYLFPGYHSGLLYVSRNVEFTLGGIDAVFRSNMSQWLGAARDYASVCSFDPVCLSSGGACHACLFPKFGCQHFNRSVSRAFLFGGNVNGRIEPVTGYWSQEITKLVRPHRVLA